MTQPLWATGWSTAELSSNLLGHWGHCGSNNCPTFMHDEVVYGHGGFYINIPPASSLLPFDTTAKQTALEMIQTMRKLEFFDRGTRAVSVEAVFYNTNTEIMTNARYVVEQFPSGLLEASSKYRHCRISILCSRTDVVRGICEVLYLFFMFYQFKREIKRMLFSKPRLRYFINPFSALEILFFWMHLLYIIKWTTFQFSSKRMDFDVNRKQFVSYFDMAHELFLTWQWAGFGFLAVRCILFLIVHPP